MRTPQRSWTNLLATLGFRKPKGRAKHHTKRSLQFQTLEARQLMTASVQDLHLLYDTGVSSTDHVTSNPTLTGTASWDSYGGYVHVEFDHNADGMADGYAGAWNSGSSFTYDPRSAQPSLSNHLGPLPLKYRTVEFDSYGGVASTGAWNDYALTLQDAYGGSTEPDLPGDALSTAQVVQLDSDVEWQLEEAVGNGLYGSRDVDLYQVQLTSGDTLVVDVDAQALDQGGSLSSLDSYLLLQQHFIRNAVTRPEANRSRSVRRSQFSWLASRPPD